MSSTSNQLVEHFFRHESANLVAVLTRAFGIRRIELVEDAVQSAIVKAMHAWKQQGVPDNPAGWVHRVAKHGILDALRREQAHDRAMAFAGQSSEATDALVTHWLEADQLPDSLLRMMFVCCHPSLDRPSQIALTLKILCGFSVTEIARGLLMSTDAIAKRIQRAKQTLADLRLSVDPPTGAELQERLGAVHDVLYLTFNEGYSTSHGHDPIRDDVCEEAARLCHLLCENDQLSSPTTRALLALMLLHAARLESRTDADGAVVLLEEQDRSRWDRNLIGVAECWLARSKTEHISRFHLEAGIAQQHCRAESVDSTDWSTIVRLYDRLIAMSPSPLYLLNRAIARGQLGDVDTALAELEDVGRHREMSDYYFVDCARARLHEMAGNSQAAIVCLQTALAGDLASHERVLLERKLRSLDAAR